jgi:hypothetical protein
MYQLQAALLYPTKFALACPSYYGAYTTSDGLVIHKTNHSQRWTGEYIAKAYRRNILEGGRWYPLTPTRFTREGNTIVVDFYVPYGPLVLDTTIVTDPGNLGFEYVDDFATPSITSVVLNPQNASQVIITLSRIPTGKNAFVRYGWTAPGGPGSLPGPTTGPRGCLRDSDPTVALYSDATGTPYKLYNWCTHFNYPIN